MIFVTEEVCVCVVCVRKRDIITLTDRASTILQQYSIIYYNIL